MKRFALFAAAVALIAQPKLNPIDQAGFPKLIASRHGKVVLVDFWATWCKPCRAQTPELVKLAQKLRERGFELVTISTDELAAEPAALKVLNEDGVSGPAYIKRAADDDKFYDSIDPNWGGAVPAMFLYNRSGKKMKSFVGETPVKEIQAAIEKLL